KGGFDIVIGNPPYVRQEIIAPPLENQNNYSAEEWREIKTKHKEKLISSVKNIWKDVRKIDKKSDLYVYFYYHGLSLLKDNGIFCFINSNSWLDVGYGAGLQEFLLKNMKPIYIIDNLKKRSFKQADVNTVIVVIQKPKEKLQDFTIKFVAFKKPFEEVINADVIKRMEKATEPIFDDEDFRIFPKTKKELLLEGVEIDEDKSRLDLDIGPENLPYIGNKWGGKYLRAPEIYFKILEKGKGKLVRLGDIAEVRRGFTTGANEFFYLKPIGMTVKEVVEIAEKDRDALIPVQNGGGWQGEIEAKFLRPVIKSPRELKTIIVRLEDLNYLVFMCHNSEKELKGTNALGYIKWGEKRGFQNRPTCKARPRWWDLGEWKISKNILPMFENERKYCFYNSINAYVDAALYWCYSRDIDEANLNLVLNSMLIGLWKEILCRPPEGLGALQIKVYHYSEMPIPEPTLMKFNSKIFSTFINKEIPSIFTELGFDPTKPIREQEPNPLPDRKALDDIVFDALGLTEEERKEVYWAVAELVKNRLEKARSV
ncbi:MAG: Eco57I restriction-modification methylase domain-containing protein, partial [Thermodesulfovibrio sp.]|nr:Eco57I restriction-modification methylase domain-containing protein [Thermodesulfovibrio sp.]